MTHDGDRVSAWQGALAVPPDERQPRVAMRGALERLTPLLEAVHRPTRLVASWSERDADDRERASHTGEPLAVDGWRDVLERLDELAGRAPVVLITSLAAILSTRRVEADAEVWEPASALLRIGAASAAARELALSYEVSAAPSGEHDGAALAAVIRGLEQLAAGR
jgi:hypothetical protein